MLDNSKVLWKEGMFLQPQHFQQAERYFLNTINSRFSSYQPYYFGVTELVIDRDALTNDLFVITSCSGVLPDGTPFSIPRENLPPTPRSFSEHFSHDQQSLEVFLALPSLYDGRANAKSDGGGAYGNVRFITKSQTITDEVYGLQRKEIDLGSYNLRILFAGESLDGHASIPLARLRRNASGFIELNETYVAPLLQISASPWLIHTVRSLLELLLAKISNLSQGRRQIEGGFAEFKGQNEDTPMHILQTLNTFTPLLNNHLVSPVIHPYELYTYLSMFTGALMTFSADLTIKNIPLYDHFNPGETFTGFNRLIRSLLDADISAGCVTVAVEQINSATYSCRVPDERLLKSARFFLGVSARAPEKELIIGVLQRIKICSRERLDLLISSAMPGLALMHTSTPPDGLSTKPGYIYFSLDQKSQFWQGIQATGSIGFYFPNNFADLKIEMLALKE